jgi:hypothetical protein
MPAQHRHRYDYASSALATAGLGRRAQLHGARRCRRLPLRLQPPHRRLRPHRHRAGVWGGACTRTALCTSCFTHVYRFFKNALLKHEIAYRQLSAGAAAGLGRRQVQHRLRRVRVQPLRLRHQGRRHRRLHRLHRRRHHRHRAPSFRALNASRPCAIAPPPPWASNGGVVVLYHRTPTSARAHWAGRATTVPAMWTSALQLTPAAPSRRLALARWTLACVR